MILSKKQDDNAFLQLLGKTSVDETDSERDSTAILTTGKKGALEHCTPSVFNDIMNVTGRRN